MNEEWILVYFEMEDVDYKVLDNLEEYILKKGGKIFVVLYENEFIGVCVFIKMDNFEYDFEMVKMVVLLKV